MSPRQVKTALIHSGMTPAQIEDLQTMPPDIYCPICGKKLEPIGFMGIPDCPDRCDWPDDMTEFETDIENVDE